MTVKKEEESWTEISLNEETPSTPTVTSNEVEEPKAPPVETQQENPQVEVEEETPPPAPVQEEKVTTPRVDKRIGQLTRKLKEKDEAFARREAELLKRVEDAEKAARTSQEKGVEVAKKALQDRMDTAKAKLRQAHESGDSFLLADANAELASTASELALVGTMVPRTPAPPPATQEKTPASPALPEAAQEWLTKNSWYGRGPKQDRLAATVAATIGDDLVSEGWDLEDPSYYEELDRRLQEEIPDRMKSLRGEVEKPTSVRPTKSPVVGTSRAATPTPAGTRPNTVRLSPDEVALATRMGVSLQAFAREKLKVEAAAKTGGYTEID